MWFVLLLLLVVHLPPQAVAVRAGQYYSLISRHETLAEITTYGDGTVRSATECAKHCNAADGDCFTFVHGDGRCGYTSLWMSEGDFATVVPLEGYAMYTVQECDVTSSPCARLLMENVDELGNVDNYGKCNGVYDLMIGTWSYQRPVYHMINISGYPRYVRFSNALQKWLVSTHLEADVTTAWHASGSTRSCHPADESPWIVSGKTKTLTCL